MHRKVSKTWGRPSRGPRRDSKSPAHRPLRLGSNRETKPVRENPPCSPLHLTPPRPEPTRREGSALEEALAAAVGPRLLGTPACPTDWAGAPAAAATRDRPPPVHTNPHPGGESLGTSGKGQGPLPAARQGSVESSGPRLLLRGGPRPARLPPAGAASESGASTVGGSADAAQPGPRGGPQT